MSDTESGFILLLVVASGVDVDALAAKLQADGRDSFVQSWNDLLAGIESKRRTLRRA